MNGWNKYRKPVKRPSLPDNKEKRVDIFKPVKAFLPPAAYEVMSNKAKELGIPIYRLIAIAVDNELDTQNPFNYPLDIPDDQYEAYAFTGEAGKIYEWLKNFPNGIGLTVLVLARREIGIEDRRAVLCGVRELLEQGMVEFFRPAWKTTVNEDKLRVMGAKYERRKYKRVEGQELKYVRTIKDEDVDRGEEES